MQTNNSIKFLEEGDDSLLNSSERHRINTHDRRSKKSVRKWQDKQSPSNPRHYPQPARIY